jgi:hypothetical protein
MTTPPSRLSAALILALGTTVGLCGRLLPALHLGSNDATHRTLPATQSQSLTLIGLTTVAAICLAWWTMPHLRRMAAASPTGTAFTVGLSLPPLAALAAFTTWIVLTLALNLPSLATAGLTSLFSLAIGLTLGPFIVGHIALDIIIHGGWLAFPIGILVTHRLARRLAPQTPAI